MVEDASLHVAPREGSNTIAILITHLAGNMRSRFTNFLAEDGEKAWRERDAEFEEGKTTREELLAAWEEGWATVFGAVGSLDPADLLRTVQIRGRPLTVLEAILRQVGHYSYHVGQIVLVARQLAGDAWRSLSIPRGESDRYNESLGYRP